MEPPLETSSWDFSFGILFGSLGRSFRKTIFGHLLDFKFENLFLQDCIFYWISSFILTLDLTFGFTFGTFCSCTDTLIGLLWLPQDVYLLLRLTTACMHDTDVREIFSGGLETTSPRPDELFIVMKGPSGWD